VVVALAAPVSLLAQDVGSGKLGGLCTAELVTDHMQQGEPELSHPGAHCSWCSSAGLVSLALAVFTPTPVLSDELAPHMASSGRAVTVSGLPFSRGPPVSN